MPFTQDEEMVEALAPDRAQESLTDRVLFGSLVRGTQFLDAAADCDAGEGGSIRTVVVTDEEPK